MQSRRAKSASGRLQKNYTKAQKKKPSARPLKTTRSSSKVASKSSKNPRATPRGRRIKRGSPITLVNVSSGFARNSPSRVGANRFPKNWKGSVAIPSGRPKQTKKSGVRNRRLFSKSPTR
tara:strand:- start:4340 stop:4699 length:360 start_codon:yes stop_codon:yes gene_type:complete